MALPAAAPFTGVNNIAWLSAIAVPYDHAGSAKYTETASKVIVIRRVNISHLLFMGLRLNCSVRDCPDKTMSHNRDEMY